MKLRTLAAALLSTVCMTVPVHAGPIIAAVGAIAAIPFLGPLIVSTAISVGAGLLESWLNPSKPPTSAAAGVSLQLQAGGDIPISFIMGHYSTAGSRVCPPYTWGNNGQTPNAYYTEIICLSDIPLAGVSGFWVLDANCPILTTGETDKGFPVTGYENNLWVRILDGSQTTADAWLLSHFGTHPTRPWLNDMIGRGLTIAVVTALYDTNLFASTPVYLFETPGIPLYNISKDSSAGGSGTQRLSDPTTWLPSNNPVVQMYNERRGVFYGSQWMHGGNNKVPLDPSRLPAANWIAGINACNLTVTNADGSHEAAYRSGRQILGSNQPIDVLTDLSQACAAKVAENAGIYKVNVGIPATAVYSFTDADIIVTQGQTFDPFPGLENTNNAIESTYPEPIEKWGTKDAPGLYNAALEAEDGGRELVASITYPTVPYALQVQRLNQLALLDSRRFRNHSFTLRPDAWVLEAGIDAVSYTSARNGYTNKMFMLTEIDGSPNMNQSVVLKEIDPADGSWNASTDQQQFTTGVLSTERPAPQIITGWTAVGASMDDDSGVGKKPTIQISYDGSQIDVKYVHIQIRLKSSGAIVFDAEVPYQAPYSNLLNGVFLPDTVYQARGIYVPGSNRLMYWSNQDPITGADGPWIDALTPNIPDVTDIDLTQLSQALQNAIALIITSQPGSIAEQIQALQDAQDDIGEAITINNITTRRLSRVLSQAVGGAVAAVIHESQVRVSADAALATDITEVTASLANLLADGFLQLEANVDSSGAFADILFKVFASMGATISQAALQLHAQVQSDGSSIASVRIMANQLVFIDTDSNIVSSSPFEIVTENGVPVVKLGIARAGQITSPDGVSMVLDFDNPRIFMSA